MAVKPSGSEDEPRGTCPICGKDAPVLTYAYCEKHPLRAPVSRRERASLEPGALTATGEPLREASLKDRACYARDFLRDARMAVEDILRKPRRTTFRSLPAVSHKSVEALISWVDEWLRAALAEEKGK